MRIFAKDNKKHKEDFMIKNKLSINISLILILSGSFITLDLVKASVMPSLSPIPSLALKGAIVFLTTLLVFFINNHSISKKDISLLKSIYVLIVLADLSLLIFKKPFIGIIIFFIVQSLLIYRNSGNVFREYSLKEIFNINTIFFALLLTILLLIYLIFIKNHTKDTYLFILFIFYGIIKSCSVLTATISFRFNFFPNKNGILMLIGVICFYFCDLNVGLSLIMGAGLIKTLSSILIWIFYTPALTLIALSGYDFNNSK